jgi:hypothetical protein
MNFHLSRLTLTCESMENPIGLTTAQPCLCWTVASTDRDEIQSAYQILVASTLARLVENRVDIRDSRGVKSEQTICEGNNRAMDAPVVTFMKYAYGLAIFEIV